MWILWIIIIVAHPIFDEPVSHATSLKAYTTEEECESERARIEWEMQQSYPGESDYHLACRLQETHHD